MNTPISVEEDPEAVAPQGVPEKFSPLKLDDDIKRILITSSSSSTMKVTRKEKERQRQEQRDTQETIRHQQGLAYDRLLQTAAASMFDDDAAIRSSNADDDAIQIDSGLCCSGDGGDSLFREETGDDWAQQCISPPFLSSHVVESAKAAGGVGNDMALMFAMDDSVSSMDLHGDKMQDNSPYIQAAVTTLSFYARQQGSENCEDEGRRDDSLEEAVRQDLAFANEYNFDLDSVLEKDLESYIASPTETEFVSLHSPARAHFSAPMLNAPTPPQPQPAHRPLFRRVDTSKVILHDEERYVAAEKLKAFCAALMEHGVVPQTSPSSLSSVVYDSDLAQIMSKHRCLLADGMLE